MRFNTTVPLEEASLASSAPVLGLGPRNLGEILWTVDLAVCRTFWGTAYAIRIAGCLFWHRTFNSPTLTQTLLVRYP
jgi:hypothetical protein